MKDEIKPNGWPSYKKDYFSRTVGDLVNQPKHTHSYTVPVEVEYITNGQPGEFYRAIGERVTKLRCSTCDSEVERKV